MLALPDHTKHFDVVVDASGFGLGAVLMQDGKPVAYEGRKLNDAESRYTVTEQECLAVVHSLHVWRCYLEGTSFTVVTDHSPNTYLSTQPHLSPRQARWSEFLQRFNFDWVYRPGRQNVADALSRLPTFLPAARAATQQSRVASTAIAEARFLLLSDSAVVTRHTLLAAVSDADIEVAPEDIILAGIVAGYGQDSYFADPANTSAFTLAHGLYHMNGAIVVPDVFALRRRILLELHNAMYAGHAGQQRTHHLVARSYWWPTMRKDVNTYVQGCTICQRSKGVQRRPAGTLQPLPIPDTAWDEISMDLITQLPVSKRGFSAILVVVDRLTKMAHFIPTTTLWMLQLLLSCY